MLELKKKLPYFLLSATPVFLVEDGLTERCISLCDLNLSQMRFQERLCKDPDMFPRTGSPHLSLHPQTAFS